MRAEEERQGTTSARPAPPTEQRAFSSSFRASAARSSPSWIRLVREVGRLGKLGASVAIVALLVVLASVGSGAFGCVLLVDAPTDLATTCPFDGKDATCGACLAKACQSYVNQCCTDGTCRSAMSAVDACASKAGASCRAVAFPTDGSPASAALAACLVGECDAPCGNVSAAGPAGEQPPSTTSCTVTSDSRSCRCSVPSGTEASNTTRCSPAVVANTICCADLDWPVRGTDCTCQIVACATTNAGSGCECNAYGSGPLTSCSTGGDCCQSAGGSCSCGDRTNLCKIAPQAGIEGYKSVGACGPSTVGCGSRKRVGRCSAQ